MRTLCAALLMTALAPITIRDEVRVELILDASEEMLVELANGQTRISASRHAIAGWIAEQAPETRAGLGLTTIGGHSSEEGLVDCGSRVLIEPGGTDLTIWNEALDGIEPAGSRALIQGVVGAVDRLAATGQPAHLIVLTSGEEGCGGEPERAAAALGDDIHLEVIGIALADDQVERFSSVATTRNAADAESLLAALRSTALDIAARYLVLVAPAKVTAGRPFEVPWSGPSGEADFIALAAPETEDGHYLNLHLVAAGSPAVLPAPSEPGIYEIRYVDGRSGRVLHRHQVEALRPELVLQAPATVRVGERFELSWTGPDAEGDFITIAPEDSPDEHHLDWIYTSLGSPATLGAPLKSGAFEIRYVSGDTGEVMAEIPLAVEP